MTHVRQKVPLEDGDVLKHGNLLFRLNISSKKKKNNKNLGLLLETHLICIKYIIFDTVPINKLWKVLHDNNLNQTLIKPLKHLYGRSTSQVKVGNKKLQKCYVNK